jgi:hypothetical protein
MVLVMVLVWQNKKTIVRLTFYGALCNGRIGRMLIPVILYDRQILSKPMFSISAYREQHREEYFRGLLADSRDMLPGPETI